MAENKKTTSEPGRLWGWPNHEEEKAYVERVKKEFAHPAVESVVAYSQLIKYPEQGLQCVQTETWIRDEAGD